jgi:thiamine pyrophosphate-dependent acetolactate synthase large subunit-like protein
MDAADHILATLKASGVSRVWVLPGDSLNGLVQPRLAGRRVTAGEGAQAASPGRQVVTLPGDGGLAMLTGDGEGSAVLDVVRTNFRQLALE